MNFLKPEVKIALANSNSIFLFKEGGQQLIHTPVAEHMVDFLTSEHTNKYQDSNPEHIYYVDMCLKNLKENGLLSTKLGEVANNKVIVGKGYNSLLDFKFDDSTQLRLTSLIQKLGIKLIFTDDFNDPDILSTDIFCANKPYLIIKPFGLFPAVSPLFGNKESCYHCFSKRLLSNQPLRNWLFLNNNKQINIATEIQDGQSIKHILEKIESSDREVLNLFDHEYNEISKHANHSDLDCVFCGVANAYTKQTAQPIEIGNVLKNNYRDGGYRTVEPEITLTNLKKLIDPITGYICNSHIQKQADESTNVIYFSSFYTQPYSNTTFKPEQFIYTTMGKGISHQQSQISALSEAVERISSQYKGNEPILCCKQSELIGEYVAIEKLTPFSDSQYLDFDEQLKEENVNRVHQCHRYQNQAINWTYGWSLITNNKVYIPFNFCYANTPFEDKFTNFFHNGGAAGNCLEEAILQGVFELIERDAVALWWYNKLNCPRIDYSTVSSTLLNQIEQQLLPNYDVWVLDLTQDIQVPVMCAIAQHKKNRTLAMGFGCHLDATISCQRALTELFQLIEIKDDNTSPFSFDDIQQAPYLFGGEKEITMPININSAPDLKTDIEFCLDQLKKVNVDVIVINNSRASLNFSSVKVVIPGLCHIFPYFGLTRLYNVPVKMGWLDKPRLESELNQQALLI